MMNRLVPDFEVDGDYPIANSWAPPRPNKSPMAEEDIMELLWQNGQVVMQSQNQRSLKKTGNQPAPREIPPPEDEPSAAAAAQQLFMQEDEMASWLHYPIDEPCLDRDLYSDLFYPPPPCVTQSWTTKCSPDRPSTAPPPPPTASFRPPVPPARQTGGEPSPRLQNFSHFSRAKAVRESTVVGSSVTPATAGLEAYGGNPGRGTDQVATSSAVGGGGRETGMCEVTMTSSPGGSGASMSAGAEPSRFPITATEDRKRKGVELDEAECQSEDLECDSPDAKKQIRGSTSMKRSRAAEVHNLSERRRRDRINEKMRALQELIPRCNKSDKASMLDEAIEYLKSLQMQVQMMSMGCGMVPMMFPGMQQYMPPMGMAMGMEMGMNRAMMPFLPMMSGSALPNPAATAHLGPMFPMPAFHMPSVPLRNPSEAQAMNRPDPMINSRPQNLNQPHMPFISGPYQQYLGLQQMPLPQNQVTTQPSTSKPSSSRETGNHVDPKTGL